VPLTYGQIFNLYHHHGMSDEPKRGLERRGTGGRSVGSAERTNARRIAAVLAGALYAASLLLPTGQVNPLFGTNVGPGRPYYGFVPFLIAMQAPLNPSWVSAWMFSAWLANPVFWLGLFWCVRGHLLRAGVAGLMSVGFGLSVLPMVWGMVLGWPGYWFWLASFLALFLGSALCGHKWRDLQ
jgi:hypothetical protein